MHCRVMDSEQRASRRTITQKTALSNVIRPVFPSLEGTAKRGVGCITQPFTKPWPSYFEGLLAGASQPRTTLPL